MTWRVHIHDLIRTGQLGRRLYVMRENWDGTSDLIAQPVQMESFKQYAFIPEDKYFLSDEQPGIDTRAFLQAMSDAAWEIGIKPKQIEDNSNELKATKFHLEDMRLLAKVKK